MKDPYRFLPFLPDFSSFFLIFRDFPPLFPDFWQIFRCQGWHSAPLDPPVAMPLDFMTKCQMILILDTSKKSMSGHSTMDSIFLLSFF